MEIHSRVIRFIRALTGPTPEERVAEGLEANDSYQPVFVDIFTRGACGNFADALALAFDGQAMITPDKAHVVTKIDGRLYDITGDVTTKYPNVTAIIRSPADLTDNYSWHERGPIL